MKTKRNKTILAEESTIRDIVRDEIKLHSRQTSYRSISNTNRYFATAKNKFMLDLIKPMMIPNTLGHGLASQIVKSILKKV